MLTFIIFGITTDQYTLKYKGQWDGNDNLWNALLILRIAVKMKTIGKDQDRRSCSTWAELSKG